MTYEDPETKRGCTIVSNIVPYGSEVKSRINPVVSLVISQRERTLSQVPSLVSLVGEELRSERGGVSNGLMKRPPKE